MVDIAPYDKLVVKLDGSNRLTTRNRRYVKPIVPVSTPKVCERQFDQSNVISARRGETVVENDVDLVQDDTVAYGPELSDANLGKGNLEQDERGSNLEVVQDDNPTIDDKVLQQTDKRLGICDVIPSSS